MVDSLEEKKAARFLYLKAFYDQAEGNTRGHLNMWELGEALGFDRKKTDNVVQYLIGEFLIEPMSLGGGISLTHEGVTEIEDALNAPEQPTHYFPPVNIINVHGNMVGSSIQQSGSHSHQTASNNPSDLASFLVEVRSKIDALGLDDEQKSDISTDIETVEVQLKRSSPLPVVVKEGLASIGRILEGATANVLASGLLERLSHISF